MGKKEGLSVEPYKGVRDFYPEDQAFLSYVTTIMRTVVERFGYVEYHASILEPSELYKSKGAENAEIVSEQTYTFTDRGGREVTLRPEMTPTAARMVASRRRELGFPLRWYSIPNLFRYERSQRGRLREHWQLNVDLFGAKSLAADAEIIFVAHAILKAFGAEEKDFAIKVGSRNFLNTLMSELKLSPEDSKKLRMLLDRRAKMEAGDFERDIKDLGVALEMLSPTQAPEDVRQVLHILADMGVGNAVFDPSIIRGFEYYTGIVFEIFDTHPENNRAMLGGGRYDALTEVFGEEKITGVGFGMGDVTVRDFLAVRNRIPSHIPPTKLYLAVTSPDLAVEAMKLAEELRIDGVAVAVDFGERKLGDQIKTAAKHKIPYVIVVGENELRSGTFVLRDLKTGEEKKISREELPSLLS